MALATFASNAIPIPNLTCHAATWYWAGEEAELRGRTTVKTPMDRMFAIAANPAGVQPLMLRIRPLRKWDLAKQGLPVLGSVILWGQGSTHTAVVTAGGGISGCNQNCILSVPLTHNNYSTVALLQLKPAMKDCFIIEENTIVSAAAESGF
jgi:hypothetical protein